MERRRSITAAAGVALLGLTAVGTAAPAAAGDFTWGEAQTNCSITAQKIWGGEEEKTGYFTNYATCMAFKGQPALDDYTD